MKNWRIYSLWPSGMLIILGLLVMMAAPALALTGEISLYPDYGPVGTRVSITGAGFTEGKTYTIYLNGSPVTPSGSNNIVESGGVFSNSFIVPNLSAGSYPVRVATDVDDSETKYFMIKIIINPVIAISNASGHVGDAITVSGTGFTASSSARILFDDVIIGTPVPTGSSGGLPATEVTIPEVAAGSHTFSAQDTSGTPSPSLSYVVSPKIAIYPASGGVGDQVTVSGNGFSASQNLGVYFDNGLVGAGVIASAKGVLPSNLVFTVPSVSRGNHTVEVKGGSDSATAIIAVAQKITLSMLTGPVGTVVSVSGTGFTANQPVSVKFNSALVVTTPPSVVVAADGSFSGSFTVTGAAGAYPVEVGDGTLTSSRNFTVVVAGSIEPKEGNVGTTISVNATGFTPNATVTINFDSTDVTTAKVAANGDFKASFKAPAVKGGEYQVTVSDSINFFSGTFAMESTPPPVPALTSPKDKAKGGRTPTFQWGTVTDPSGVTYDFQLVTDSSFTKLLFDEKGLTDTKFTITEAKKLEPVKKDAPYYWQVKAVDGASNESDWSTPFSFNTGSTFSLPTWAIYASIGVGVLAAGLLGFWLGRRTTYY